jgi:hypothetical protein
MVEVFKTNVNEVEPSEKLIRQLVIHFPGSLINFDLEDCDKILRVEAENIVSEKIIKILNANGYSCEVLV